MVMKLGLEILTSHIVSGIHVRRLVGTYTWHIFLVDLAYIDEIRKRLCPEEFRLVESSLLTDCKSFVSE